MNDVRLTCSAPKVNTVVAEGWHIPCYYGFNTFKIKYRSKVLFFFFLRWAFSPRKTPVGSLNVFRSAQNRVARVHVCPNRFPPPRYVVFTSSRLLKHWIYTTNIYTIILSKTRLNVGAIKHFLKCAPKAFRIPCVSFEKLLCYVTYH